MSSLPWDLDSLQQVVQAHCKRTRQLHQAQQQLCWDLLLVIRGGRPAFMLDYAFVPAKPLLLLLQEVQQVTGVQCALLSWGSSCHLVCNLGMMRAHLQAAIGAAAAAAAAAEGHGTAAAVAEGDGAAAAPTAAAAAAAAEGDGAAAAAASWPLMLGFGQGAVLHDACREPEAQWVQEHVAREVLCSLQPLQAALQELVHPPHKVVSVDLERLKGLPLMPTLNGWLLGYPVIYVVDSMEGAQQASKCLSMNDISVFKATASAVVRRQAAGGMGGAHEHALGKGDGRGIGADMLYKAGTALCAFSVPTQLLAGIHAVHTDPAVQRPPADNDVVCRALEPGSCQGLSQRIEAWVDRMQSALRGEGWVADLTWVREDRGLQPVLL